MILNSNKDYGFQINVILNCKDCGDTNLTFDTYKDYEKNDFPFDSSSYCIKWLP